jgi:hypothetical protein
VGRLKRSIQLDAPAEKIKLPPGVTFYKEERPKGSTVVKRITQRIGNKLIIKEYHKSKLLGGGKRRGVEITERSAIVKFSDIFKHCIVHSDDDDTEPPYARDDVYSHELLDFDQWIADIGLAGTDYGQEKLSEAFYKCNASCVVDDERHIIKPNWETGIYEYARAKGASKQVARELEACSRRRDIKRIVEWRRYGEWQYYYVSCKFYGIHESLSGIDDEEYANDYVRNEIADQVAYALEKRGYVIRGSRKLPKAVRKKGHLERLHRNLNSQNWQD